MKVYFNNSCKICRSEINLYKKESIQEIDWVDITNNSTAEKETAKKDKELLRRLHVKDGDKIIGGAEAFLYVWKKIPKYNFLYSFFNLPVIFTFFKFGYEIIAYFLYLKNKKQLKS
jgi:predicted DCC family thiol-disulfide oxidoreductase YuxK